ncbi:MAG: hypothetical protein NVS2B15_11540 [Pseudarthrobacter sp.]
MIRHGQSAANVDTSIYNRIPDYRIPLTPQGLVQAAAAGERIRRELDGRQVCVYVSPYLRAYQTLEALNLGDLIERVNEEPRLREQDWANFQISDDIEDQKELRNAYGHFFYRFREGESGSDVYDRISSFLETLHRHWSRPDYAPNALLARWCALNSASTNSIFRSPSGWTAGWTRRSWMRRPSCTSAAVAAPQSPRYRWLRTLPCPQRRSRRR